MSVQPLQIHRAAQLLKDARRAVALTGAGVSTPSGIPDFRSPGAGLWTHLDPMQVASLSAFRYDPARFYAWFHELACLIRSAQPNAAHVALARLEQAGRLRGVVTQNIDGLHQAAGSQAVFELHGNLRRAVCVSCYRAFPTQGFFDEYVATARAPHCPECGGYLKPDAVLFGEQLPHAALRRADELFLEADLVLVIGSSLEVSPAAGLPLLALDRGAGLIIVNRECTYLDDRAAVLLQADLAAVLPQVAEEVLLG